MSTDGSFHLRGAHDVIAAVPYLIGFHPDQSIVCLALDGNHVTGTVRVDLPATPEQDYTPAAQVIAPRIALRGQAALIIGYGAAERVNPAVEQVRTALTAAQINVIGTVRVTDGRYYCADCGSCSPDGEPLDPAKSRFPAEAVFRGMAPLPNRAALVALIDPISGPDRQLMATATKNAMEQLILDAADALPGIAAGDLDQTASGYPAALVHKGITAVQDALETTARGDTLAAGEVAWLSVYLLIPEVRGHAWRICDGGETHRRLWIDVTRRAAPAAGAPAACLLANNAYLAGDGALAAIAADRALQLEPDDPIALMIAYALESGIPPETWQEDTRI